MELVTAGHAEAPFQVERGHHLGRKDAVIKIGSVRSHGLQNQIARHLALRVPTSQHRIQMIGKILRIAGESMPPWRRERIVDSGLHVDGHERLR